MPSDSDFMLTAEERRLKRSKRRRIVIGAIALIAILVGGFVGVRPGLNAIKAWQARRHAAKAFDYIEKEDWLEARKEATAAYQLRATEPQALRAVARFLSRARQPDALAYWRQLESITPLTREDRQDEAAIAIISGETSQAEAAVRALLESKEAGPTDWLLAAQLSIQKGEAEEGVTALRKIFGDSRATEQEQLRAALLELALASGTDPADERLTDAWSRIERIGRGKSAAALDALALLAQRSVAPSPHGTRSIAITTEEIRSALENNPLSKAPQKLLALDLQAQVDASRRGELIAKGITQFKDSDASDLLTLARWLNGKGEFEKTLEAVPLEKALLGREVFLQYLDALGGLSRWSEIKQLLEGERYPLDPVVQKMYLARCNGQLAEKTAAENNWQRALEAAGGDPTRLITVAEYAEKNGVLDVARSAFNAAAIEAPKLRAAQQGRLRLAQRTGDTNQIHAVLADMLKIWPNDAAIQNDEGYTRLLLMQQSRVNSHSLSENEKKPEGADQTSEPKERITDAEESAGSPPQRLNDSTLDELGALAQKLVEKNPRSMPHRTFLALARLKQNRAKEALAVYENITVTRGALTPPALAVHAAVLAANDQRDAAKKEAAQIRDDQLAAEERQLIADLRSDR